MPNNNDNHEELFNRGNTLFDLGKFEEALKNYNQAVKLNPNNYLIWLGRGMVLSRLNRSKRAIVNYKRALELNSNDYRTWFYLGLTLNDLNRYEEAIVNYNQASKLNPNDYRIWFHLGSSLMCVSRYIEAIDSYEQALNLNPDNPKAWDLRGVALISLGRYEDAIENYDLFLDFCPDDKFVPWAWYLKGNMNIINFEYKKSIECFGKAVQTRQLAIASKETICFEGLYYFALGMDSLSQKLFDNAKEQFLKSSEILEKDALYFNLSLDLKTMATIAAIDHRFDTTHFTNLHSFQEVITKIVYDMNKINLRGDNIIISNIVSTKLLFFSTVEKALKLKEKISPKSIEKVEKILTAQKINNLEDIITDYKIFINHLEEKRKIGITNINQLPQKDHKILTDLITPTSYFVNNETLSNGAKKYFEELVKGQLHQFQEYVDVRIGLTENKNKTTFELSETVSREIIDKIDKTNANVKEISDKIEIPYWDPKSDFTPYFVTFEGNDLDKCVMKVDKRSIPLSRDQLLQTVVVALYMKHSTKPVKERCLSDLMIYGAIVNTEWQNADNKIERHLYWIFKAIKEKLAGKKHNLDSNLFTKTPNGWCIYTLPQNITISEDLENLLISSKSILPRDELIALKDNT